MTPGETISDLARKCSAFEKLMSAMRVVVSDGPARLGEEGALAAMESLIACAEQQFQAITDGVFDLQQGRGPDAEG